jgi:hypothetical protein
MSRIAYAALAVIALGCHRPPSGSQAASPTAAPPAPPAPPCPVVPVALVMTLPNGEARTVLSLNAQGSLDISLFENKTGAATLNAQGCLAGKDGLWAEWAPRDRLWTPHEALDVAGDCLAMSASRSLCIAADGKIETRAPNEPPPPKELPTMAIRGYGPEARCASLLLLATFMSMMPSMAVVDARARRLALLDVSPALTDEGRRTVVTEPVGRLLPLSSGEETRLERRSHRRPLRFPLA